MLMYLDNTMTVQYINCVEGTCSQALCHLAIELWKWWLVWEITLYAELPGSLNVRADFELRLGVGGIENFISRYMEQNILQYYYISRYL